MGELLGNATIGYNVFSTLTWSRKGGVELAIKTVPMLTFLRFLVTQKIFVVISDLEYVLPKKHRKGEVSITPEVRSGIADRLVANSILLNFGILLKDESVLVVTDNSKRRWRNLHQIRNGRITEQSMRMRLSALQYLRFTEMGVKLLEEYSPTTVLYTLDYSCFRWLTDPTLVGRMYFPHDTYLQAKATIVELEEKLPWVDKEMRRLSKQIAWHYIDRPTWPRVFRNPQFEYEYGPTEPSDFVGWQWVLETGKEPTSYLSMPDGPLSYPSYVSLAESRYQILYHLRPALMAIVREFELAAWEHKGRFADKGWSNTRTKRTLWQVRELPDGRVLKRRALVKSVRVRAASSHNWRSNSGSVSAI